MSVEANRFRKNEGGWILHSYSRMRIGVPFCMNTLLSIRDKLESGGNFETRVKYDYPRKGQAVLHYREVTH